MDPNNVIVWVNNMVEALSDADPENASRYRGNGEAYVDRLRAIDADIRDRVESIPADRRKLVLDHEVFSYFADEYGFEIAGAIVPDTTDSAEPSARDVAQLVEVIRETGAPAIFVGETASQGLRNLAAAISEELGGNVRIVATLTGSLAPPGAPGDTYIGFLEYNVQQIIRGLE
jgi:ABC-type Zn uptake system ZnuABC Zn-binding protein ZnuA